MTNATDASEFQGNTLDEAINKAVLKLGVPKDRLEIKIVCEEKRGLFGMQGAKTAKIKVMIKKSPIASSSEGRSKRPSAS